MKKALIIFILVGLQISCVPKRQKMDFSAQDPLPPTYVQPPLNKDANPNSPPLKPDESAETGQLNLADLMAMAETLREMLPQNPSLYTLTSAMDKLIHVELERSTYSIENSYYFKVFLKEAVPQVSEITNGLKTELRGNVTKLNTIFLSQRLKVTERMSVRQLAKAMKEGFRLLLQKVQAQTLHPLLKDKLMNELNTAAADNSGLLSDLANIDETSTTLTVYAASLTKRLDAAGRDSNLKDLRKATILGQQADQIKDAQTALSALIYVWNILTPKERARMIGGMSPELYDYLKKQSDDDLDCLASKKCGDFLTSLSKSIAILPKLKKFGVQKIKDQINGSSIAFVRNKLRGEIFVNLSQFGKLLSQRVSAQVEENLVSVDQFNQSFAAKFLANLPAWALNIFSPNGTGPSILSDRAFNYSFRNYRLELKPYDWANPRGTAVGPFLNYLITKLQTTEKISGKDRHALFSALNFMAEKHLLRHQSLVRDNELSYKSLERVELIRGLSRMAAFSADYHQSNFNTILGGYKLFELFPDQAKEAMDRSVFPQDAGFLLALSALGLELHEFERQRPPIFLLTADRSLQFLSRKLRRDRQEPSEIPIMAGVMDVIRGEPAATVKAESISRAILALTEFFDATEHIETSKMERLRMPDVSGNIPMEQLLKARKELRNFIVGLCNMLSNVAIQDNGLVATELNLSGTVVAENPKYILANQALAIQALTQAARITGLEIYNWDALALLNKLNAGYFDQEADFYKLDIDPRGSLYGTIQMLMALTTIKPRLVTEESKVILERMEAIQVGKLAKTSLLRQ